MATKSKLELLLELDDKLFNNKLSRAQKKLSQGIGGMKGKLGQLRDYFQQSFAKGGTSLGRYFSNAFNSIPFANLLTNPIVALTAGVYKIRSELNKSSSAYKAISESETKLATVLFNTIGARQDTVDSIMALGSAQEKLGIIDRTTSMAAVEQLATNVKHKESIEKLIPAFNDLIARQYGLNASAGQAAAIGRRFGRVLNGQTSTLTRYGIQFTEAQERILQTGTEAQRASTLFDILNNSVGGVNAALAATPEGQLKQMAMEADGVREQLGAVWVRIQTAFVPLQQKTTAVFGQIVNFIDVHKDEIVSLINDMVNRIGKIMSFLGSIIKPVIGFFMNWYRALQEGNPAVRALTTILGILIGTITAYQVFVNTTAFITGKWSAAQKALNIALTTNPIGVVIAAIAALVALVVVIIKKWDEWGAALTLFMGPVGLVIGGIKSIYDHWESIKEAFQEGGIIGGLKRIGVVLLDALLKPMSQLLEWISKIPGLGNLAAKGVDKIAGLRKRLDLETEGEKRLKEKTKRKTKEDKPETSPVFGFGNIETDDDPQTDIGQDINSTVGKGNQVKNVTINVDSIVSGGITMAQSEFEGMTRDDLERYLSELFRRISLNADLL